MTTPESMEIDDSLYSRQRYMLGDKAMKMMASSTVLLIGCDPLGLEIAKNVVLAGVKALTVADSEPASEEDVSQIFYITPHDVTAKKTRAEACVQKLQELNSYVAVSVSNADVLLHSALTSERDCRSLTDLVKNVDCVVASQTTLLQQKLLNELCRALGKKFICCNIFGLFSSLFCDFGSEFMVADATGEELKEILIANITHENPGVVTCSESQMHGLEDGDRILINGIKGMGELNGKHRDIKVISPYAFSIGDTSGLSPYISGGTAKQVLVPRKLSHQSLEEQISKPDFLMVDSSKILNPAISHVGFMALNHFRDAEQRLPKPWNRNDAEKLWSLTLELMQKCELDIPVNSEMQRLTHLLSYTCRGVLPPLAAVVGGIAAQEVLKSVTGKYTPLTQWMYMDASELIHEIPPTVNGDSNVTGLSACLHSDVVKRLSETKAFMVGCGAVGCEMLKNLALLGVASDGEGKLVVTDNDVIEKSNLNRQFLFRSYHIRQHKSTVAAVAIKDINLKMNIVPLKNKVCPETEHKVFSDSFLEEQDVVINALDNVEARRYVDSRCVTNQRALVESGTMGAKGHVQVVVPFVTESYSSQQDPADVQFPYCTLKSFPSQIAHTIQWARDKFESLLNIKPSTFNKFWKERLEQNGAGSRVAVEQIARMLSSGEQIKDAMAASKLLAYRPRTWQECLSVARCKFEKYFNHKAQHLLHAFPLDTKLQDGTPFWSAPKCPPRPLVFDPKNSTHLQFVTSAASLLAKAYLIPFPKHPDDAELLQILQSTVVPAFRPSRKVIVTDENQEKPEEEGDVTEEDAKKVARDLQGLLKVVDEEIKLQMHVEDFEKDDDSHINFITSASNLRAEMYSIEAADRLKTKKIAGRIIPAISTTTAAVAGLATIQFLQLITSMQKRQENGKESVDSNRKIDSELSKYRNCFLNLGLPFVLFSEPAAAQKIAVTDDVSFTLWDRWEVHGRKDYKLSDFVQHYKAKLNLTVSMVMQGAKMVYVPVMPGHSKRLNHLMTKLIKMSDASRKYVDLTIGFENNLNMEDDDLSCPPVRYFFGQ